jgi:hypothetical protein
MKIKWTFEFDAPEGGEPVVRDESRWLHNKLVEVTGLNFTNGVLDMIVCKASESTQSSSPVVYRPERGYGEVALDVIPDRRDLDMVLPKVYARAKAEALVRSAERAGLPNPVQAVVAMLAAQEEFVTNVNDIYAALDVIGCARAKATKVK